MSPLQGIQIDASLPRRLIGHPWIPLPNEGLWLAKLGGSIPQSSEARQERSANIRVEVPEDGVVIANQQAPDKELQHLCCNFTLTGRFLRFTVYCLFGITVHTVQ